MSQDPSDRSAESEQSLGIVQKVTPNFVRRSFALKFSITLVIMGLVVVGLGLAATDQVKGETKANVNAEYEQLAIQESDTVERWVKRNRLAVRLTSSDEKWANGTDLTVALSDQQSELPADVWEMHVVERDPSPTTIVSSTALDAGSRVDAVGRGWLATVSFGQEGEVRMSDVYRYGNEPVVGFASPIPSAENRFLLIEYELSSITGSLAGAERAESGFTQVVNADEEVMIDEPPVGERDNGDAILTEYSANEDAAEPITAAEQLRDSERSAAVIDEMPANADVIDETYVVGYAPVPDTEWVVLVHAPYSSVFGLVQQIQIWGLAVTGLIAVLIGAVGAVVGYNTSKALSKLTRKTEQMREGDLDVDLRSSRIDDIGRLYAGFASMRDSLKTQISEAESARKEAEVSRAEAMEMNDYLQEKAEEFGRAMEATAAGDMTRRMETDGENDAMDRIATSFNEMIEELEKTTGQLKSFSDEVAESGDVVLQSAESVRDASEQVAESIQMISDDAYGQKERLTNVSQDLDELVDELERLQTEHPQLDLDKSIEQFDAVASTLQAAADRSEDMLAESENVAGAAEEQAAELNEVSSRADQLKRYARPLGDILDRFETEAEHEFVFSGGPSQSTQPAPEDED